MNNGWTQAPANPDDLPWQIKAGKRVLWFIVFEAHGEWPERRFTFAGSIKNLDSDPRYVSKTSICDLLVNGDGGIYYESTVAYQEQPGEP